jgi:hypothetical protein
MDYDEIHHKSIKITKKKIRTQKINSESYASLRTFALSAGKNYFILSQISSR